jgi:O-antigen/teichoic acid export membrane protein
MQAMSSEGKLLRAFLSGSAWAALTKVLAIAAAFAVNAALTRLLDPAGFGTYLLASSIATVASVMACLGLNNAVVRLLGQAPPEAARATLRQVLMVGGLGAVLAALLVAGPLGEALALQVFRSELLLACLGWGALWALALTLQSLLSESLRGIKRIAAAAFLGGPLAALGLALALAVTLALGLEITTATAVALAAVCTLLVLPLGSVLLLRHTSPGTGGRWLPLAELGGLALPMLMTNLSYLLLNQADLWVLGMFLAKQEVALYGAALQVAALVSFPLFVLNAVVPPYIAESSGPDSRSALQASLRRATGLAGYAGLLAFAGCLLLGDWLLALIYGEFYREAYGLLAVIAVGRLANLLAGPCGLVLLMTGSQWTMLWITAISGLLTVAAMAVVVRPFGAFGVALVAAIAMALQNVAMLIFSRRNAGLWTHAQLNPRALLGS